MNGTQHGYLVLADISGYTSFVAATELEHSHEILSDLLDTICKKIESLLKIHKLEGDAVFAYAPESMIQRGETLLELMESTYLAFRDRQLSIQKATTCTCNACRNISTLDLKFIAHHGDYIIQQIREIRELVGSDVNLIHRLAKNHLSEATGWRAYIMLTEPCLNHLKVGYESTYELTEEYEHLGKIRTNNIDLHQRYQELTEGRRIMIVEKDADVVFRFDFSTPPALTWEWLQEPERRNLWSKDVHWYKGDRSKGRAGRGASNHCAHGKSLNTEVILDWHPFEYSTTDSFENGRKVFSETLRLEQLPNGGTRLNDFMQLSLPLPQFLRRLAARFMMRYVYKYDQALEKAVQLASGEFEKAQSDMP